MADDPPDDERPNRFPFLPILLAGAGSALAAVLLARLGLVGTVIGAALTPIIIITVQELGQRPVKKVAAVSRVARGGIVEGPETRLRPWERVRWRRVLVLASAAFALTAVAFTAVEHLLGRSVATDRRGGILNTGPRDSAPTTPADTTERDDAEAPTTGPDPATGSTTTTVGTDPATTQTEPAETVPTPTSDEGGTTESVPGAGTTATEPTATAASTTTVPEVPATTATTP